MNFLVWTYFFTCGISRRKKRRGKLRQSISFFLFYKGWVSIFIISRRESVDSRFFDSMVRLILAALFYHSSRNALTQKLDRCTQTNPVQSVSVVINVYSCEKPANRHLFHTYWDSLFKVLSFVSLIGRRMYFKSRSLPINLEKISICMKYKHHTIESAWTILIYSLQCILKLTRSLCSLVRIASQLVNNIRSCELFM